jgi:hypothetical protein
VLSAIVIIVPSQESNAFRHHCFHVARWHSFQIRKTIYSTVVLAGITIVVGETKGEAMQGDDLLAVCPCRSLSATWEFDMPRTYSQYNQGHPAWDRDPHNCCWKQLRIYRPWRLDVCLRQFSRVSLQVATTQLRQPTSDTTMICIGIPLLPFTNTPH